MRWDNQPLAELGVRGTYYFETDAIANYGDLDLGTGKRRESEEASPGQLVSDISETAKGFEIL